MRYNPRGPMSAYPVPVQGSLPPPGSALFVEPAVLYYLGSIHLDTVGVFLLIILKITIRL